MNNPDFNDDLKAQYDAVTPRPGERPLDFLNRRQRSGHFHGYACANDSRHALLVATEGGWVCEDCGYAQPFNRLTSCEG